jgi:hypothetical protein
MNSSQKPNLHKVEHSPVKPLRNSNHDHLPKTWQNKAMFASGISLILIILTVNIAYPVLTVTQYHILNIILALAAACIPGLFVGHVQVKGNYVN